LAGGTFMPKMNFSGKHEEHYRRRIALAKDDLPGVSMFVHPVFCDPGVFMVGKTV
jgi:hypothetical protein